MPQFAPWIISLVTNHYRRAACTLRLSQIIQGIFEIREGWTQYWAMARKKYRLQLLTQTVHQPSLWCFNGLLFLLFPQKPAKKQATCENVREFLWKKFITSEQCPHYWVFKKIHRHHNSTNNQKVHCQRTNKTLFAGSKPV